MSQVIKKLQSGGTLTIDGKKYDATPELIQSLSTYLSGFGESAAPLAGLTAALQRGENVTYDSIGNTITGMQGNWAGIDDRASERRKSGASKWRRDWDATFNNDAHRFRKAVSLLSGFAYNDKTKSNETPANLTDIFGDKVWYKYADNDDGTKRYLDDASENLNISSRLDAITDYLKNPEEDMKKKYRLADWYNAQRIAGLRQLYQQHQNDWDAVLSQIKTRARNNELTPEDKAFLANFNIIEPDKTNVNSPTSGLGAKDKLAWANAGYGGLEDLLGDKAHLNDDGSLSLNNGASWGWILPETLAGKNIWFNDDFYKVYGADGSFDPYKNYTLYNNRLYALDNPTLARILNQENGFNAKMKAGDWTGADAEILTRFSKNALDNPVSLANNRYSAFFENKPMRRYSDMTGILAANNPYENQSDRDQIVQYVDLDDDSLVIPNSPYRHYNYKYAILDENGKWKKDVSREDLHEITGGKARPTGLQTYLRVIDNSKYGNRYVEDIIDSNNKPTEFRFYRNISNPTSDVILHMPDINIAGGGQGKDIILPEEIAEVLSENTDWTKKVIGNAKNQNNFVDWISSLVQSWWANTDHGFWFHSGDKRRLKNMGFSDEEIDRLQSALNEVKKGNRFERRSTYLSETPQSVIDQLNAQSQIVSQKNGGKLTHLPKLQFGGLAGGSKQSIGVTAKRVDTKSVNPKNAAGLGEIGSNNWSQADNLDLAALAGDLGSLGLAFVPGANVGSALAGAASSTARYKADRMRGTSGAGLNYLVNLGMDAAVMLPFLGAGIKATSVVGKIKKALPILIKAASVYGLGSTFVNSAKKIANGEKWTTRDLSMVVNGLTAAVGLSRQGGLGKSKTKVTASEPVRLEGVDGQTPIELSSNEMAAIKNGDELLDALFTKAKAQNTNLTKEEFNQQYKVDDVVKTVQRWKPNWKPSSWFKKQTVTKFEPKTTTSSEDVSAEKGSFKEWWHSVGAKQKAYNQQLMGEQPTYTEKTSTTEPRIVIPKNSEQGLMRLDVPAVVEQVPVTKTRTVELPLQGVALPQWINPYTDANYQRNQFQELPGYVMAPLYQKKGGKIIKAQRGTWTPNVSLSSNTLKLPDFNPTHSFSTQKTFNAIKIPGWKNPYDHRQQQDLFMGTNDFSLKTNTSKTNNPVFESDYAGHAYNFDLNPAMNWARAFYSMGQSNKQLRNFLNRQRYHMEAPLFNAPRFIDSGTGTAYDNAANKIRMFKPVTSDALTNDAMARQRQADALNLEMQADLARSQEYGKYKAGLDEFNNKVVSTLTDVANKNRQFDYQHNIEDVQQKNANIAEKSKFFDQAAYATQDWYSKQQDIKNRLRGLEDYDDAVNKIQLWWNKNLEDLTQKYKGDLSSESAQQELAGLKTQLDMKKQGLGTSQLRYQLAFPFIAKKGGKLKDGRDSKVTYSRDPYPELLLQNSRAVDKFVEKLSDHTIKLILETKPFYVS